jgi:hypothetical protein
MKLLLRLYPRTWLDRYGDELEMLLDEYPLGPLDVLDLAWGGLDARLQVALRHTVMREEGTMLPMDRDELRDELQALLAARDELGEEHEVNLMETFLDRWESQAASAGSTHPRARTSVVAVSRWSAGLLLLWSIAGVTSIAFGIPWSLGSTAPAEIEAAALRSGYLGVLLVLMCAFCVLTILSAVRLMIRTAPLPVR